MIEIDKCFGVVQYTETLKIFKSETFESNSNDERDLMCVEDSGGNKYVFADYFSMKKITGKCIFRYAISDSRDINNVKDFKEIEGIMLSCLLTLMKDEDEDEDEYEDEFDNNDYFDDIYMVSHNRIIIKSLQGKDDKHNCIHIDPSNDGKYLHLNILYL